MLSDRFLPQFILGTPSFTGSVLTSVTGISANGVWIPASMMNYRNSKISLITTGSATLTVKIQVSYQEKVPDFTSASSPTNHWVYGGSYDIDPWTFIAGSTGVSASGTDINKILVVNENNPRWINLEVSGYSAGTVYAFITANNNI